ncbi:hypothetical protein N665_1239s0001 [Sinapis alba]|nr:hypothetical protein N665_1239s0001 [Sinapis alba]
MCGLSWLGRQATGWEVFNYFVQVTRSKRDFEMEGAVGSKLTRGDHIVARVALGSHGLWDSHIIGADTSKRMMAQEEVQAHALKNEDKWVQEDQLALEIIHNSLSESILEAYSHCKTTKDLWESLKNVYGNFSNLNRVFEFKRIINNLSQEGVEFNLYFGKFSSLWAELDMLRPFSTDPDVIRKRYEPDKVFSLLLNLSTSYNQLIKHILRQEKLPDLDDVCAQIQKEQTSHTLFTKERKPALKDIYNKSGRLGFVPGYKKTKKRHVRKKIQQSLLTFKSGGFKFKKEVCPALEMAPEGVSMYSALSSDSNGGEKWNKTVINDGPIRMSDIKPLIKAAKAIISAKKSANVVIANGDRVKIEGIGNLKLFDRESTAFYMPCFASNLLSVKKATVDLNCQVFFRLNDVEFQDLKTGKVIGEGNSQGGLYHLQKTKPSKPSTPSHICMFSNSSMCDSTTWHARLG